MPNWCNNFIQIRHKDPAMIERVLKGKDGLFMEFFPTPEPLTETVVGYPGEDKQAAQAAQQAANLEQFGYKDWYDWNVANWGTKWDIELEGIERMDDNSISAFFDSAWSPPIGAYAQLVEMGFDIDAMYYCANETKFPLEIEQTQANTPCNGDQTEYNQRREVKFLTKLGSMTGGRNKTLLETSETVGGMKGRLL